MPKLPERPKLERIVYVSYTLREPSSQQLDDLLRTCARNNLSRGLSGMLLYAGGRFLQVLEGTPDAIDLTFGRIREDDRHQGVLVLERVPIREREFHLWHMGFRRVRNDDARAHPAFAPVFEGGFHPEILADAPSRAVQLLREFAAEVPAQAG